MVSATTDVSNSSAILTCHAAARVWRHLADNPETPDVTRMVLLEHLPGIEADPVNAGWEAAYGAGYVLLVRRAAVDDDTVRTTAGGAVRAAHTANVAEAGAYHATANAARAVELGCAGSDRIGLALTLLAESDDLGPGGAWELAGLIITTTGAAVSSWLALTPL